MEKEITWRSIQIIDLSPKMFSLLQTTNSYRPIIVTHNYVKNRIEYLSYSAHPFGFINYWYLVKCN